jgi:hypothetical protein
MNALEKLEDTVVYETSPRITILQERSLRENDFDMKEIKDIDRAEYQRQKDDEAIKVQIDHMKTMEMLNKALEDNSNFLVKMNSLASEYPGNNIGTLFDFEQAFNSKFEQYQENSLQNMNKILKNEMK